MLPTISYGRASYYARFFDMEIKFLQFLCERADEGAHVCFISIDLEGPTEAITEFGLALQQGRNPGSRKARHIIVDNTQSLKRKNPKPCGHGIITKHVAAPEDLGPSLAKFFDTQLQENNYVVLTGFDISNDLIKLKTHCHWVPPSKVVIIDAATIFKTLTGGRNLVKHKVAMQELGICYDASHLHNAANDAWYALDVLFRRAEQSMLQIEELRGEETLSWHSVPAPPPPSPDLNRDNVPIEIQAKTLSKPTLSHHFKLNNISSLSSLQSQGSITPTSARLKKKPNRRKRRRGPAHNSHSAASSPTQEDERPTKKRKLSNLDNELGVERMEAVSSGVRGTEEALEAGA